MLNFRLKFIPLAVFIITAFSVVFPRVTFAAYDVACVAEGVADYMDGVLSRATPGKFKNIRFLTPAFNMTEPQFEELVSEISALSGTFARSDVVVSGNAYNVDGASVVDWMERVRSTEIANRPVILTETGWYPHAAGQGYTNERGESLRDALNQARSSQGPLVGALIFNGFGTNPDINFAGQVMSNEQFNVVCNSGACGFIGVNSAAGLFDNSNNDRAAGLGMKMTLGIINNDPSGVASGSNNALAKGITPVLRIGVGDSSGGFDTPAALYSFMEGLDPLLTGVVYIIVGPNEPNAEGWADPDGPGTCDRDQPDTGGTAGFVTVRGMLRAMKGTRTLNDGTTAPVTNLGVKNAAIKIYEGVPDSQTGKRRGDLVNPPDVATSGVINLTRTDEDGFFEIQMRRGSGRNRMNYLVVFCQNTGTPSDNITTIYALDSTKNLDGLMLYEDCPQDVTTPDPPDELPYVSQTDFLSCDLPSVGDELYNLYKGFNQVAKGLRTFINLDGVTDGWWVGKDLDTVPNPNDGVRQDEELTHAEIDGRYNTNQFAFDVNSIYGALTCLTVGCLDGDQVLKRGNGGVLPSCDVYRTGNEALNARNMYGFAESLASPSFGIQSDDVKRYISVRLDGTLRNREICNIDGHNYTFREFAIPTQWNQDEIAAAIGDHVCSEGELFCLPEEYFPWNKLINFYNESLEADTRTTTERDSFNSVERDRVFDEANKGLALSCDGPTTDEGACATPPKAFAGRDAVVLPKGNLTSPIAAANSVTRGAKTPGVASPLELIYDPKTDEDEQSLAEGKITKKFTTVSSSSRGILRIGKPKSLCICPWPLRILDLCGSATNDQLMNFFDTSVTGYLDTSANSLRTFLYGAGYSYVTKNTLVSVGTDSLGQFFGYNVDILTAIVQQIYDNIIAPWFVGSDRVPYQYGAQCQGQWVAASEEQAAACAPNWPDDPACITQNGCGGCKCVGSSATTCSQWQVLVDDYTCSPSVDVPPIDPEVSTSIPLRNLTNAAGNFMAAFRGPIDPNPRIRDAAAVGTEATGVTTTNQAKGNDLSLGESIVDYWDQLSQSVSDPNFSNKLFTWRKVIRNRAAPIAMPTIEDTMCQFGTNDSYRSIPNLPDNLIEVLEVAGDAYHVPAPLILSYMYAEGSFNPTSSNPLNGMWTEDNVDSWINEGMEEINGGEYCDPNSASPNNPYNLIRSNWDAGLGNAVLIDFPNRSPNICNFLDQTYAVAQLISRMSYVVTEDPICFGINLGEGLPWPTSCSDWTKQRLVIAAKDYTAYGYCYDNIESGFRGSGWKEGDRQTFDQCFPNTNSCRTVSLNDPNIPDASYIFNVIDVFWHYTLPSMRNRILGYTYP